jgi:hypothetical protein
VLKGVYDMASVVITCNKIKATASKCQSRKSKKKKKKKKKKEKFMFIYTFSNALYFICCIFVVNERNDVYFSAWVEIRHVKPNIIFLNKVYIGNYQQ